MTSEQEPGLEREPLFQVEGVGGQGLVSAVGARRVCGEIGRGTVEKLSKLGAVMSMRLESQGVPDSPWRGLCLSAD